MATNIFILNFTGPVSFCVNVLSQGFECLLIPLCSSSLHLSYILWRNEPAYFSMIPSDIICWSVITTAWRAVFRAAGPEHHCCRAQKSNEGMVVALGSHLALCSCLVSPALFLHRHQHQTSSGPLSLTGG